MKKTVLVLLKGESRVGAGRLAHEERRGAPFNLSLHRHARVDRVRSTLGLL